MQTLKFKAQLTNAFFVTVNQKMFSSSSQLPTTASDFSEIQFEIVLKWLQNGMDTKVTHGRVEESCLYSISFPYFELSHMIVTFPY